MFLWNKSHVSHGRDFLLLTPLFWFLAILLFSVHFGFLSFLCVSRRAFRPCDNGFAWFHFSGVILVRAAAAAVASDYRPMTAPPPSLSSQPPTTSVSPSKKKPLAAPP